MLLATLVLETMFLGKSQHRKWK